MPVYKAVVAIALAAVACATTNASAFAEVEDYIANANCKDNYLHRPVCVGNGECYAHGTDEQNGCTSVEQWKWPEHAVGVLPHPRKRVTANGSAKQKHVWAYLGDVSQGEAIDMYNKKGAATVTQVLNTPVNQLSFIANVNVEKPSAWFVPGANNTNGCGQMQTWDLPFGFDGKSSQVLEFHQNLQKLHSNGITITLTMGSWCTQFPIKKGEEWTESMFGEFVSYFKQLRVNTFGGALDGIDFDWEGFCNAECLKGQCSCAWSDAECAGLSPDALAAGHSWMEPDSHGVAHKKFCWMFPTHSTIQVMAGIFALSLRCVVFLWRCLHCVVFVCCLLSDKSPPTQVMTGITQAMKAAGFVVTLVPMSTSMYTGAPDTSPNQNLRNVRAVFWRSAGTLRRTNAFVTCIFVSMRACGMTTPPPRPRYPPPVRCTARCRTPPDASSTALQQTALQRLCNGSPRSTSSSGSRPLAASRWTSSRSWTASCCSGTPASTPACARTTVTPWPAPAPTCRLRTTRTC